MEHFLYRMEWLDYFHASTNIHWLHLTWFLLLIVTCASSLHKRRRNHIISPISFTMKPPMISVYVSVHKSKWRSKSWGNVGQENDLLFLMNKIDVVIFILIRKDLNIIRPSKSNKGENEQVHQETELFFLFWQKSMRFNRRFCFSFFFFRANNERKFHKHHPLDI